MRSDREHCASRVAVEEEEERRGGGGEEQATDIKSNNPHLTGGEQADQNYSLVSLVMQPGPVYHCHFNSLPIPNSPKPRTCLSKRMAKVGDIRDKFDAAAKLSEIQKKN